MPNTPRLCLDGRTAQELPLSGLVAQELIDQLVAAKGDEEASEWIERHRTVLLSHPGQVFSGQLRRFETDRKVSRSPLYWFWEKGFIKNAGISVFHRFRPADQISFSAGVPTLTTILPTQGNLPFFLSRRPDQFYVVPSHKDATHLERQYQIAREQVFVVHPCARRLVHFNDFNPTEDGWILFLVGDKEHKKDLKRLTHVVATRYPEHPIKVVSLKEKNEGGAGEWLKLLAKTKICFYLCAKPFDWPVLALESIYFNVPTLFPEKNTALKELLPHSALTLSRFLVEQPELKKLKEQALEAKEELSNQGAFQPLALAAQYRDVYQKIKPASPPITNA